SSDLLAVQRAEAPPARAGQAGVVVAVVLDEQAAEPAYAPAEDQAAVVVGQRPVRPVPALPPEPVVHPSGVYRRGLRSRRRGDEYDGGNDHDQTPFSVKTPVSAMRSRRRMSRRSATSAGS